MKSPCYLYGHSPPRGQFSGLGEAKVRDLTLFQTRITMKAELLAHKATYHSLPLTALDIKWPVDALPSARSHCKQSASLTIKRWLHVIHPDANKYTLSHNSEQRAKTRNH